MMDLSPDVALQTLLDAALPNVAFDGWSDATFKRAIADCGMDPALASTVAPRGAVDLAVAFHRSGDAEMLVQLGALDQSEMRFRDRIAQAVRLRLELISDREAVRRSTTLFSLPLHLAEGAALIWETADKIWTALGDRSDDVNWYTKRATLSGVYGATVLYWLGDDSPGHRDTWAFLDRRIDDVMQIEKLKGKMRSNPVLKPLLAGPDWILSKLHAPTATPRRDIPGSWSATEPK